MDNKTLNFDSSRVGRKDSGKRDSSNREGVARKPNEVGVSFKNDNPNSPVTREEIIDIIKQVVDNINMVANYLMEDVNNLFQRFTYPTSLRLNAIESLLIQKGICTKEEIDDESKKIHRAAVDRAKEVKEAEMKAAASSGDAGHNETIPLQESAKIEKFD